MVVVYVHLSTTKLFCLCISSNPSVYRFFCTASAAWLSVSFRWSGGGYGRDGDVKRAVLAGMGRRRRWQSWRLTDARFVDFGRCVLHGDGCRRRCTQIFFAEITGRLAWVTGSRLHGMAVAALRLYLKASRYCCCSSLAFFCVVALFALSFGYFATSEYTGKKRDVGAHFARCAIHGQARERCIPRRGDFLFAEPIIFNLN